MKTIALLLALAAVPAFSQESAKHKLARRLLAAAACATSAYDGYQTASAIGRGGVYEMNPIGFNNKMLSLKAAGCVAPLIVGEWGSRRNNSVLTNIAVAADALETGVFGLVIAHNHHVIDGLRRPGELSEK